MAIVKERITGLTFEEEYEGIIVKWTQHKYWGNKGYTQYVDVIFKTDIDGHNKLNSIGVYNRNRTNNYQYEIYLSDELFFRNDRRTYLNIYGVNIDKYSGSREQLKYIDRLINSSNRKTNTTSKYFSIKLKIGLTDDKTPLITPGTIIKFKVLGRE